MTEPDPDIDVDLLEFVSDSVIVFDLAGSVLHWNAAAERLYGWTKLQAEGQSVSQLFNEPLRDWQEQLTRRDTWSQERIRTTVAGVDVRVQTRRVVRYALTGAALDLVETGVDISALHGLRTDLKLAEYRCESIFQASPISLWELDFREVGQMAAQALAAGVTDLGMWLDENPAQVRDMMHRTRVLDVNAHTVALFGRGDKDELLQGSAPFWPESSNHAYVQSIVAALSGELQFVCETRLRNLDGSVFDVFFSACYPPDMVARGRIIVTVMDISEKKRELATLHESEMFYRDMFRASGVSTWHIDSSRTRPIYAELMAKGLGDIHACAAAHPELVEQLLDSVIVLDVNDTTVRLFGATDRSQIVGGTIAPFWLPGRYEALLDSVVASWGEELGYTCETALRTLAGQEIQVIFTSSTCVGIGNNAHRILSIIDMTARVNAQNALLEVQANFAHAARISSLGELAASIAHEVNQPLAAITTRGEAGLRWLDRAEPNIDEVRQIADSILADARRASDIVARIRTMATPQRNPHRLVSVNSLVNDCMLFLKPELRRLGIRDVLQLAQDSPVVCGDAVQLQQVLVNLALNAFHALESTAQPRLIFRTVRQEPQHVCFEIEDNGAGIADEHLGLIFQSFFTTKRNGMGIGLAICRSIAEAHHGAITVAKVADGGMRFTLRIPLAAADGAA